MHESIKKMLETPGLYAVGQQGSNSYTVVEVDERKRAHQLTPLGKRDGILRPEGWDENAVVLQKRVRHGNQA